MGVAGPGWLVLGTPVRCHGLPAAERTGLAALLQGFPAADPAAPAGVELAIEGPGPEGAGWRVADGRGGRWHVGARVPACVDLEYLLVSQALRVAPGRHVLHAGAVAGPGGTCLLVGESGAGKTSLTLWLWSGGLRLVSDDLCPLRHGSLAPEVFPRALHMDCEYSPRLLARIPPRPADYPPTYYPFPEADRSDPPPVAGLLVLERGEHPEGRLTRLAQAEVAHRLLGAVVKGESFRFDAALADMMALARRCPAWVLRSSTPEGAGERAAEVLAGIGATGPDPRRGSGPVW